MRRALLALAALLATSGSSGLAAQDALSDEKRRLIEAKAAANAASARAADLDRAAAVERDAAERARTQELAVAARVARAEADIRAARARVAIVDRLLARQRAELGLREAPVGRLLAALQAFARRPVVAAVAQPGSVDDVVHVRAVLGSVLPVVRDRTASLRAGLAETRALQADAALAATALRRSRVALVREREALAALQARHSGRATALKRDALAESDRAIAMGEAARDIVDQMADFGDRQETLAGLERLSGPPVSAEVVAPPPPYRLPVAGRLVTGFGEISDSGVRARGLTFAVAPAAAAVVPAAGRIVFARPFRGYGMVVIVDHGDGWTSVVTGLAATSVARGASVAAGQRIGTAAPGDAARVTVELYRRNRPIDIAALVG